MLKNKENNKILRPLAIIGLCYPVSIAVAVYLKQIIPLPLTAFFMLITVYILFSHKKSLCLLISLVCFFGIITTGITFSQYIDKNFIKYHSARSVICGEITDISKNSDSSLSLTIKANTINGNEINYNFKLNTTLKNKIEASYYDKVICFGNIEMYYPNSFSYQSYNAAMNIFGTVETEYISVMKLDSRFNLSAGILRLRDEINKINSDMLSDTNKDIVNAIVTGNKSLISYDLKNAFDILSVSHVLVVSGLHVSILGLFIYNLLSLILHKSKLILALSIPAVFLYALMTGFNIPAQRAFIMISLYMLASTCSYRFDGLTALGIASIIILLRNPISALSISFALSFCVSFSIILLTPEISSLLYSKIKLKGITGSLMKYPADGLSCTIAAFIGFFPFAVLSFKRFSLLIFLLNLLIIPLCQGIIIFDSLALIFNSVPIVSDFLFKLTDVLSKFMVSLVETAVDMPFSSIEITHGYIWLIAYVLILAVIYYLRKSEKFLSICLYSFLLFSLIYTVFSCVNKILLL